MGLRVTQGQAGNEFDILRKRIKQQGQTKEQEAETAIKRRFAAMGNFNSGAAIKQEQLAKERVGQETTSAMQDIGFAEQAQQRQDRQVQEQRQFEAGEAEKNRSFSRGEREAGQGFQMGVLGKQQDFAKGERIDSQGFAANQARLGENFQQTMAKLQQDFTANEASKGRDFAEKQFNEQMTFAKEEMRVSQLNNLANLYISAHNSGLNPKDMIKTFMDFDVTVGDDGRLIIGGSQFEGGSITIPGGGFNNKGGNELADPARQGAKPGEYFWNGKVWEQVPY
jgi:hypothetical protein